MTLTFHAGRIHALYADDLALPDLAAALGGELATRRASNVEPTPDGRWTADLSPVSGPVLPSTATRKESLDAEADWLREHRL